MTRAVAGRQMQARQEPSSTSAPWEPRYSTDPDLIATRQEPQFPARHPASILMRASSASSSSERPLPSQTTVLPERAKLTSRPPEGGNVAPTLVSGFAARLADAG